MTSIAEVRAALDLVRDQLLEAHSGLRSAAGLLAEATATLTALSTSTAEPLTPPELLHAEAQHKHTSELVEAALHRVELFMAIL